MDKINITAVSYLNTKPLLYGLFKSHLADQIQLTLDIPSGCAQRLKDGRADLGLVPVAIIPELIAPHIVSDYCIGTVGAVKTVCIYGDCPIEDMTHIYLDFHSRTSVELTRLLLREYWQHSPVLLPASEGYEAHIGGRTGGLIIGDRAIAMADQFRYEYDLGETWMAHTGMPFVFAAWVSTRPLPAAFLRAFNEALAMGVAQIPELMYLLPSPAPGFDLEAYFTQHISYTLDAPKRQALDRFLTAMAVAV